MLVDYHIHLLGHDAREATYDNIEEFVLQAQKMGISKMGFSDHNRYYNQFDFAMIEQVAKDYPEIEINKGIEMDFTPGKEKEIADFLAQFDFDYIIGSLHYIDGWMFDHPKYKDEYEKWEIDKLYQKYYSYVAQAAESGLFDIIGHLDLIKIFNYKPQAGGLKYAVPALETIAENDIVIEVNTNGLNKPVKELYPTAEILAKAYKLGVKVTLGSDAHHHKRVGENLEQVRELLLAIGYEEIASFNQRERTMEEL